jgi:S1-C subfamily serine protease
MAVAQRPLNSEERHGHAGPGRRTPAIDDNRWARGCQLLVGAVVVATFAGGLVGVLAHRAEPTWSIDALPRVETGTASPLPGAAGNVDLPDVISAVRPSVVIVEAAWTEFHGGLPEFLRQDGSGFVIHSDGLVATVAHLVEGSRALTVTLGDGRVVRDATVVGTAPGSDLAVIDVRTSGLPAVTYGRSSDLRVGDPVIAIGNALGLGGEPTAASGIVAGLHRDISTAARSYSGLIQTDLAMNEGQSGGPLIDIAGRVVGVNVVGLPGGSHLGFAIAIDDAGPVLAEIVARTSPRRPTR